jgi:hypothetical protein
MGLFASNVKRGLAWINNRIERLSHPLHVITTSDGVHLRNIGGDVVIKDSSFSHLADDSINIYPGLLHVAQRESDSSFLVRFRHIRYDLDVVRPNQEVAFVDSQLAPRGRAIITSVVPIDPTTVRITTSTSVPLVQAGDSAAILAFSPKRILIQGNTFYANRSRAPIVNQGASAVIVQNEISYSTGPAIINGADHQYFFEGLSASNVRIRENTISHALAAPFFQADSMPLQGAIAVGTTSSNGKNFRGTFPAHQSISLHSNIISQSSSSGIFVASARKVWVLWNQLLDLLPRDGLAPIEATDACEIVALSNISATPPRIRNNNCK